MFKLIPSVRMRSYHAEKTKPSLNNDEIFTICEFLDMKNPHVNMKMSLVSKECYRISCFDKYWKSIIKKQQTHDGFKIEKWMKSKKSFVNAKRKYYLAKVFREKSKLWPNLGICLSSSLCLIVFTILFIGFISLIALPVLPCSRKVKTISKERVIDSIPLNGTCIQCNSMSFNNSSAPLMECQFNSTINGNQSPNDIPLSFPCCWRLKSDNCIYDNIITNQLMVTLLICTKQGKELALADQKFLDWLSTTFCIGVAFFILFSLSSILTCGCIFLSCYGDHWFYSNLENGSFDYVKERGRVYLIPKKNARCVDLLTFVLILFSNGNFHFDDSEKKPFLSTPQVDRGIMGVGSIHKFLNRV